MWPVRAYGVQRGTQAEFNFARGSIEIERDLSPTGGLDFANPFPNNPRAITSRAKRMFTERRQSERGPLAGSIVTSFAQLALNFALFMISVRLLFLPRPWPDA
jgi:hypothetical protein